MITPIPTIAHQLDVEPFKGVHVPSALVVDGEAVSRNEPCQQLAQLWPELSIVGDVGTGTEALQLIDRFQPDVVFLDIQLPGLMGLDVARQAQGKCHVIFVTTHEADATAAFEVGALDYVLKPILPSRLLLAIARIKQASNLRMHRLELLLRELAMNIVRPPRYLRWINAAAGDSVRLIAVEDVQYFRADGKYTVLVTSKSESLIRKTLQELNSELDPAIFWQIHRSTIVNTNAIEKVQRSCRGRMDLRLKNRTESLEIPSEVRSTLVTKRGLFAICV